MDHAVLEHARQEAPAFRFFANFVFRDEPYDYKNFDIIDATNPSYSDSAVHGGKPVPVRSTEGKGVSPFAWLGSCQRCRTFLKPVIPLK